MKLRKATLIFLCAALAVMATPLLAQDACMGVAGNLVANCGFETGDFTGWTQTGDASFTGVTGGPYAWSGIYGAFLGSVYGNDYLSQSVGGNTISFQSYQLPSYWALDSISVVPFGSCGAGCETYFLDFWLANFADDTGNTIPNDFTVLWNGSDFGPSLVDSGAFPYTEFSGYVDGTSPVPEPGSLILLGSGVLGLAGVVRRKLML